MKINLAAATERVCTTGQSPSPEPRIVEAGSGRTTMASPIATTSVALKRRSSLRNVVSWLEEAGLSLLLVLALPLVILAVGAPVALVVRLLMEIGRRW